MLINEVCNLTGLTKKAISYYEKQGLIKPCKGDNGYREYAPNDIARLNEISLYRKLDISIKDIKLIINSKDKQGIIKNILQDKQNKEMEIKLQKKYLKEILNNNFEEVSIRELNEELMDIERNSGEFIKRELLRAFPSGIGRYMAYHFAPYLNEPIDTPEKYKAWNEIVEFLDEVPEIKIPRIVQMGYENTTEEMAKQMNDGIKNEINSMLQAQGEELEKYKEKLLASIEKQNDKVLLKLMNPFYKFKKELNEFFSSSGYYDIFIPNMKILSNDYRQYQEKLMELNEKLSKEMGIRYDENMRVVLVKDKN